jgi:hypothetical protein
MVLRLGAVMMLLENVGKVMLLLLPGWSCGKDVRDASVRVVIRLTRVFRGRWLAVPVRGSGFGFPLHKSVDDDFFDDTEL